MATNPIEFNRHFILSTLLLLIVRQKNKKSAAVFLRHFIFKAFQKGLEASRKEVVL
jgi:hypothetical protein